MRTPERVVRELRHARAAGRKGLAKRTVGKVLHSSVNLNCRGNVAANPLPHKKGSLRCLASGARRGNCNAINSLESVSTSPICSG